MRIADKPIGYKEYYRAMQKAVTPKYEALLGEYEKKFEEEHDLYEEVKANVNIYKTAYKLDLSSYEEFNKNDYITGEFLEDTKTLFMNKRDNYKATTVLYKPYKLASLQKECRELFNTGRLYEKMLDLTCNDYRNILNIFYNKVHEKLIVDGYGYVFEAPLGWICINRCKLVNSKPLIDWNATKKNKEKLLAEGKRLWNKDEAEYAASCGMEYDGVDYRVYLDTEVVYEIPLLGCTLDKEKNYKLKIPLYEHLKVRGLKDEQVIEQTNGDLRKICSYPFDLKHKLRVCLKADDILYLNFIRNEGQQPASTPKNRRKSRQ